MKIEGMESMNFADLNEEEMLALKNAEEVINKLSSKKIYLMAMYRD